MSSGGCAKRWSRSTGRVVASLLSPGAVATDPAGAQGDSWVAATRALARIVGPCGSNGMRCRPDIPHDADGLVAEPVVKVRRQEVVGGHRAPCFRYGSASGVCKDILSQGCTELVFLGQGSDWLAALGQPAFA